MTEQAQSTGVAGLMSDKDVSDYINGTGNYGYPTQEEKHNVHTFLHKVSVSEDTTKTGFIGDAELGIPKFPVRTHKKMALIADSIMDNDLFKKYFSGHSEIITSTSLSRQGFLVKQSTTTTKNVADVTKVKKENSGWFKKKEEPSTKPED